MIICAKSAAMAHIDAIKYHLDELECLHGGNGFRGDDLLDALEELSEAHDALQVLFNELAREKSA